MVATKNLQELKNIYQKIKEILDLLEDHMADKLDKPISKPIARHLLDLKEFVSFFKEINQKAMESSGMAEGDRKQMLRLNVPGRDPDLEQALKEGDILRCQVLISQAKFIKKQYEGLLEGTRPFQETTKEAKKAASKGQKKKVKKKFKNMKQSMKWKKM